MAVPPPKLKGLRAYCDESNTDGKKTHPVYGAILIPLDNVRKVQRAITEWRQREQMHSELKWERMHGGLKLVKFKSFVDLLMTLIKRRRLMHFKAIILDRRAPAYLTYSKGSDHIGFYKFYYHGLHRHFAPFPLKHRCRLRVIIDERTIPRGVANPYIKLKYALNNGVRKDYRVKRDVIASVHPLQSKDYDLLQAADVLMGAIGYHNQDFHLRPDANKDKVELARYIAVKFALRHLKLETRPMREDLKIVRWYWPGQERQRWRRRPVDNPRHSSRRPLVNPGK